MHSTVSFASRSLPFSFPSTRYVLIRTKRPCRSNDAGQQKRDRYPNPPMREIEWSERYAFRPMLAFVLAVCLFPYHVHENGLYGPTWGIGVPQAFIGWRVSNSPMMESVFWREGFAFLLDVSSGVLLGALLATWVSFLYGRRLLAARAGAVYPLLLIMTFFLLILNHSLILETVDALLLSRVSDGTDFMLAYVGVMAVPTLTYVTASWLLTGLLSTRLVRFRFPLLTLLILLVCVSQVWRRFYWFFGHFLGILHSRS